MPPTRPTLRFDSFELNLETGELLRDGERVALRPQAAEVLRLLARNRDRLVSRDEIRDEIWGDSVVEFDQGINACVRQIRQALGDDSSQPRYVDTVPRRGYRFIAPVEKQVHPPAPGRHRRRVAIAAAVLLLVAGIAGGVRGWISPEPDFTVLVFPIGHVLEPDAATFPEDLAHQITEAISSLDSDRLRAISLRWEMRWDPEQGLLEESGRTTPVDFVAWFNVGQKQDQLRVELFLRRTGSPVPLWQRTYEAPLGEREPYSRRIALDLAGAIRNKLPADR